MKTKRNPRISLYGTQSIHLFKEYWEHGILIELKYILKEKY